MAPNDTDDQRSVFDNLRNGMPGHDTLLAFYDVCAPLAVDDLRGLWRGGAWATGTRFDGLLGRIGWYGKLFRGADDVQALLFHRPSTLLGWLNRALIWPFRVPEHRGLVRHPAGRARLREMRFRGQDSAAMIYDYLPIIDHFRRVDATVVIGLMDLRGRRDSQLFFWLERDLAMLRLNNATVHRLTRLFLDDMQRRGRGTIVNIASVAGLIPMPGFAVYSGTKAFVHQYTRCLDLELRATGSPVWAISVCPAAVRETGFQHEAGMQRTSIFRDWLATTPDVVARDIHRALHSGRRIVVSGRAMRWVLPLAEVLPRWLQDRYLLARYRRELSAATRNRD